MTVTTSQSGGWKRKRPLIPLLKLIIFQSMMTYNSVQILQIVTICKSNPQKSLCFLNAVWVNEAPCSFTPTLPFIHPFYSLSHYLWSKTKASSFSGIFPW